MSRQKGQLYYEKFMSWASTMSDEDFVRIIYPHTGKLNKADIKKLSGVSAEALKNNKKVKDALKDLEGDLRERGVLPPLSESGKANQSKPKEYKPGADRERMNDTHKSHLERDNHDLRVQVEELEKQVETLKSQLAANGELVEAIGELEVFTLCPSKH
ncbi:MAG: VPA1267 family protein [Motiliproteus sp.]|nr:VPA1267 family protein [Motiliproteus sp.]